MTTAQAIVQQLAALPEDAQREVLDFVEFIKARTIGQGAGKKKRPGRPSRLPPR